MSQDNTLLDLELRLLVARHGKARVSEALSAIVDVDLAAIDAGIKEYGDASKRSKAPRRPGKSVEDMLRNLNGNDPETRPFIEKLARAYGNREFLPELRDVRYFLQARRIPAERFRSRTDAFPVLLHVLAECRLDELQALDEERRTRRSDLGIIADQILGKQ